MGLVKFDNITDNSFIEIDKYWTGYGQGTMLIYVGPNICKYIQFTALNNKRTVIDSDLMDVWKKKENE